MAKELNAAWFAASNIEPRSMPMSEINVIAWQAVARRAVELIDASERDRKALAERKVDALPELRLVVIESPLAGDFERNQRYARYCLLDCLRRGEAPFASHLLYTQALDDQVKADRELGIQAGFAWANVPGVVRVFYQDLGMSHGMVAGFDEAIKLGQGVGQRTLPDELMAMFESGAKPRATPGAA